MRKLKLIKTGALGWAIVLGLATPSSATLYNIDFTATDGSTVSAVGTVNVSGGVAISGTLNLSGPGWVTFPGTYSLYTGPAAPVSSDPSDFLGALPNSLISPNAYGTFDNVFSSTSPYIDAAGLLFTATVANQPIFGGTGTLIKEVFLTYDGGGQFGLWDDFNGPYAALNGSAFPYDADQAPGGQYEFTGNVAVPEPTTTIAGAMLLLPFGISTLRMLRKSRTA